MENEIFKDWSVIQSISKQNASLGSLEKVNITFQT